MRSSVGRGVFSTDSSAAKYPPPPTLPHKGGGSGESLAASTDLMDRSRHVHRSFNVERPASASITEMIQNRITICGSVHPNCSK